MERTWAKASRCGGGECLEVSRPFAKSTYSSESANCLEMGGCACDHVLVRDSKLGDASPMLHLEPEVWSVFVEAVKSGEIAQRRG